MNATSACPGVANLREYLLGRMAEAPAAALEAHLAACAACRRLLPAVEAEDDLVADFRSQAGRPDPAAALLDRLAGDLRGRLLPPDATTPADAEAMTAATLSPVEETPAGGVSLAPPQQPDEIGRLGGYRILKELGRGGMGVVYQAEDVRLMRRVAVKAMLPALAANPKAGQRFLREAQAMAAVEHDHIVRIYQVDEDRGVPFLAMEFLKGEPLDERLKRESRGDVAAPLPLAEVLRIGREIAEGLAAAHANGLIHRDIKPGNVWLEAPHGRVKILDFGLARAASQDAALTQEGAIVGTPAYMAPEQARGETVDGRCDLFSLGVVFYRLCTGRQPFRGSDSIATLMAVALDAPASPLQINPELPQELSDMVMKLLEKDPARRFSAAGEVVQALLAQEKRLARTHEDMDRTAAPQTAVPPGAVAAPAAVARRRRVSALTACAAALLGLGLAAVAAVIVVKVRTPDGKETEVTAPTGSKVDVDPKGGVTVTLPGEAPAAAPDDITNGIGMKLKRIQPGKFLMGSPKEEEGRVDNEGPQHEVEITKLFYMGAYPVTKGQFAAFVKDDGYQTEAEKDGKGGSGLDLATAKCEPKPEYTWRHPGFSQGDDHPVVDVSWNDAQAFCAWLSKKEGKAYELPTEAEWEYACRAGTTTRYWCGDTDASLQGNANIADASLKGKCPLADFAVAWDDGYPFTSPVGSFKANPWGLYDMNGNVWQWCADGYDAYQEGSVKDPNHKDIGSRRALRGGSWLYIPFGCRAAQRDADDPASRNCSYGFRVVLRLPARTPVDDAWVKQVAALPPDKQAEAVVAELKARNPGFDGKETHKIDKNGVTALAFRADLVTDLSPVRALTGLRTLNCCGGKEGERGLLDLSPLAGMRLTELHCSFTQVSDLSPLKGMPLTKLTCDSTPLSDLTPLQGLPLTYLSCEGTKVTDLGPLKGLPLTRLRCASTKVSDLAPLKGTPLKALICTFKLERDADVLRSIPTLETINGKPAKDVLSGATVALPPVDEDFVQQIAGLFPNQQVDAVAAELKTRNPEFDGKVTYELKDGAVVELAFSADQVGDLSPLRALTGLRTLKCCGSKEGKRRLADLSPLAGMPLTELHCDDTKASDLSPLKGMPLTSLTCDNTPLSDLAPLQGMPLTYLSCEATKVTDLGPLQGMPLTRLRCSSTKVSDLAPLKDMKLTQLSCWNTRVSDLAPLKGMPLTSLACERTPVSDLSPLKDMQLTALDCYHTKVSDLSPLKGMPLKHLNCDYVPERDAEILRSIKTLEKINDKPAADFWKDVDAKKP